MYTHICIYMCIHPNIGSRWPGRKFTKPLINICVQTLSPSGTESWCCCACQDQWKFSLVIHFQLWNVNQTGAAGVYQSLYPPFVISHTCTRIQTYALRRRPKVTPPVYHPGLFLAHFFKMLYIQYIYMYKGEVNFLFWRWKTESALFLTDICLLCAWKELGSTLVTHKERYSC